jgi:GT2 family glycosyltransferase
MPVTPVYVVLVNYNGFRDTVECLESLLRSDYPALRVIVVDNGSADRSMDAISEWAAGVVVERDRSPSMLAHLTSPPVAKPVALKRYTRAAFEGSEPPRLENGEVALVATGANLGFAGANNVAFRHVLRTDPDAFLLLLNNDTVIAPGAVTALARRAAAGGVGAVGATLLQYHSPDHVETLGGALVNERTGFIRLIGAGLSRASRPSSVAMDFISGCCMLITPAALRRVGAIDERFFIYSEDADWGVRARQAGLTLAYSGEAEVWHKGGATTVQRSVFHDYHTAKSLLHFVRKHRPYALPIALANLMVRMVATKVLRGQLKRAGAVLNGCRDFVRESLRLRGPVANA